MWLTCHLLAAAQLPGLPHLTRDHTRFLSRCTCVRTLQPGSTLRGQLLPGGAPLPSSCLIHLGCLEGGLSEMRTQAVCHPVVTNPLPCLLAAFLATYMGSTGKPNLPFMASGGEARAGSLSTLHGRSPRRSLTGAGTWNGVEEPGALGKFRSRRGEMKFLITAPWQQGSPCGASCRMERFTWEFCRTGPSPERPTHDFEPDRLQQRRELQRSVCDLTEILHALGAATDQARWPFTEHPDRPLPLKVM